MNHTTLAARSALTMACFAWAGLALAADGAKPPTPAVTPPVANPAPAAPAPVTAPAAESGLAAVYSDRLQGKKTASGERYDRNALTAAHKTLPFGTQVKVTNTSNQKEVTVRINDRGPTQAGRILDISPRAAKALGISPKGMAEVSAVVVAEAAKPGKSK
jgi:rare lipoprotein A